MMSTAGTSCDGRQQVIHKGLRDQLAFFVVCKFLVQGGADAVSDAAHASCPRTIFGLILRAAVVAEPVAQDFGPAEIGIDAQQQQMKFERKAGIHLHAAIGSRERAAGRHLVNVL